MRRNAKRRQSKQKRAALRAFPSKGMLDTKQAKKLGFKNAAEMHVWEKKFLGTVIHR